MGDGLSCVAPGPSLTVPAPAPGTCGVSCATAATTGRWLVMMGGAVTWCPPPPSPLLISFDPVIHGVVLLSGSESALMFVTD